MQFAVNHSECELVTTGRAVVLTDIASRPRPTHHANRTPLTENASDNNVILIIILECQYHHYIVLCSLQEDNIMVVEVVRRITVLKRFKKAQRTHLPASIAAQHPCTHRWHWSQRIEKQSFPTTTLHTGQQTLHAATTPPTSTLTVRRTSFARVAASRSSRRSCCSCSRADRSTSLTMCVRTFRTSRS